MTHDLSETEGILLDKLDEMETRLLAFERTLVSGNDWRTLVHGLFRDMHNLKSSLSMAGFEALGRLAHGMESMLDRFRSGMDIPDTNATSLMLEAIDVSRSLLNRGIDPLTEENGRFDELLASVERSKGKKPQEPSMEITFPLDSAEMGSLKTALDSGKKPYILEKFVEAGLSGSSLTSLPIFDAVRDAGTCIAWRKKEDTTGGAVLSILFASDQPKDELGFILFDPFYSVDMQRVKLPKSEKKTIDRIARILIVDDELIPIILLQHHLAAFGRVDTAMRGKEAVEKFGSALKDTPYDIVFLDIMMPEMDGLSVLRAFREMEQQAGILIGDGSKVVMASALSDFPSISDSFKDLCDAYIVKPFEKEAIRGAVTKFGFLPVSV